jgi:hypothetical protein
VGRPWWDARVKVVQRGSTDQDSLFAVVLPGSGYPALAPALHWPARLLAAAGWRLAVVSWNPETEGGRDPVAFVEGALQQAAGDDLPDLLLTKSLGTLAASWAAQNDVPGVWLTPLLRDEAVLTALQGMDDRSIVVGGTADGSWLPGAFEDSGIAVLEVPGADHALELPDWRASLQAQSQLFEQLAAHLGE